MYYSNHQRTEEFSQPTLRPPEPYIVASMSKNSTVRRGDPAFLSCMVESLGKYTVSWISQRDLRILTIDRITYTADERFQSLYNAETNEWILHIKWTERKDTGIYECQISTMPVKSLALYLIVLSELDYNFPCMSSEMNTLKLTRGTEIDTLFVVIYLSLCLII